MIASAEVGKMSPWFIVGCVESLLKENGSVTADDWNRIISDASDLGPAMKVAA